MNKYIQLSLVILSILIFSSSFCYSSSSDLDEKFTLTKKEYLQYKIGSYVWGFNEFDTDILITKNVAKVNIYYDNSTQSKNIANSLKSRFEQHIKQILQEIVWAKEFKLIVTIHGEDRSKRGY